MGKISSIDHYRPTALTSIVSKVLEIIILDRIKCYIDSSDNQFGFKAKHTLTYCM